VTYISQGNVTTCPECGSIFSDELVTRLLQSLTVKEF